MEPPPRLYHYEGLFTACRSIDLTLKIFFTLLIVIVLILIAAWNVSRKSYRRAPKDIPLSSNQLMDLSKAEKSGLLVRDDDKWRSGVFTARICGRTTLLVNDWKLICQFQADGNLDFYYSAAPSKFRRRWFGLWFSDYTLLHRPQLQSIVLHTFDTLSNDAFSLIGLLAVQSFKSGRYQFVNSVLDSPALDAWIWEVVMELVFFNSPDFSSSDPSDIYSGKYGLLEMLRKHMVQLLELHQHGRIQLAFNKLQSSEPLEPDDIFRAFDHLLSPLIRHAIESFMHYREQCDHLGHELNPQSGATSLLHQFVQAHHHLNKEGEFVSFVSSAHIAHLLVEVSLILRITLLRTLRVLMCVLALRTDWQFRLCEEAKSALHDGINCPKGSGKKSTGFILPSNCIRLQHTNCLPWTKALVNEAIRFSAPGFPISALREALRDGQLEDFDYAESELVLLNQLVYFSDKRLWESDSTSALPVDAIDTNNASKKDSGMAFRPDRFLDQSGSDREKKQIQLSLPVHWARCMLTGYTICVPNDSIFRLLTSILVHLFGTGLKVSTTADTSVDEQNDSFRPPRDPPKVSFTYTNT